jgi:hypothetical protein
METFQKGNRAEKVGSARGIIMPLKWLSVGLVAVVFYSCGSSSMERASFKEDRAASLEALADSVNSYTKGIATDTINGITHNFIRQADVKCKVDNVLNSSEIIEDAIALYGGYITNSNLNSDVHYTNRIAITEDSLKEITYYTTVNTISARVPNKNLDSVMRKTIHLAAFVDYQRTSADDVKFKLYANQMAERRIAKHQHRVEGQVDKSKSNIQKINEAEENLLTKQELADNKRLESIEMIDKVNYSTITIHLYQPASEKSCVVLKPDVTKPYEPSFAQKFGKSFLKGFEILKTFVLFVTEGWSIWLILIGVFFGIKKIVNYFSSKEEKRIAISKA